MELLLIKEGVWQAVIKDDDNEENDEDDDSSRIILRYC